MAKRKTISNQNNKTPANRLSKKRISVNASRVEKSALLEEINGFKVLPVKVAENSTIFRYLYFKQHIPNKIEESIALEEDNDEQLKNSLFIVNITTDCTEEKIRDVFRVCGNIIKVLFNSEQKSGARHCIISYDSEEAVRTALSLPLSKWNNPIITANEFLYDSWIKEYKASRADPTTLQKQIDEFMIAYDEKKDKERKDKEKTLNEPDEEGFILVQPRGRRAVTDGGIHVTAIRTKDHVQPKQQNILKDFYRFQRREEKKDQLFLLQKKFEEDKLKIARLKSNRKFKPY